MYTITRTDAFDAWLSKLKDARGKARIIERIRSAERGNFGDCESVDEGVSEMRIHFGPGYRVYFARSGEVVLGTPLGDLNGVVRAKKPQRLPVVLSTNEVRELLKNLEDRAWLIGCLLYGSGLRLMEAIRLGVKDIEFDRRAIIVRDGKGRKDRVVTLADELIKPLQRHLQAVLNIHEKDLRDGFAAVYLPYALARK